MLFPNIAVFKNSKWLIWYKVKNTLIYLSLTQPSNIKLLILVINCTQEKKLFFSDSNEHAKNSFTLLKYIYFFSLENFLLQYHGYVKHYVLNI